MPGIGHSVDFSCLSNWMTTLGASQGVFMWFDEGNILKENLKIHSLSMFSKWLESIIVNNSVLALHRVTALPEWKDIILRKIDHQTLMYLFHKVFGVPSNHRSFYPRFFPLKWYAVTKTHISSCLRETEGLAVQDRDLIIPLSSFHQGRESCRSNRYWLLSLCLNEFISSLPRVLFLHWWFCFLVWSLYGPGGRVNKTRWKCRGKHSSRGPHSIQVNSWRVEYKLPAYFLNSYKLRPREGRVCWSKQVARWAQMDGGHVDTTSGWEMLNAKPYCKGYGPREVLSLLKEQSPQRATHKTADTLGSSVRGGN